MVDEVNSQVSNESFIWKISPITWLIIGVISLSLLFVFQDAVDSLLHQWEREEYSHAYLLPFICGFFVWQKKDVLEKLEFSGSWMGLFLAVAGLGLFLLGSLSAIHSIMHYAIVIVILGLVWAYLGDKAFKQVYVPFLILAFMVPLPGFLYQTLSGDLQLLSSKIGVSFIRMFDISVYLEGNVIDLGTYKLQVVEACSGLRYLFPLVTLGFIAAYFYNVELWKRLLVFLSAVPITVLMNSFRIGVIGVLVEHWGQSMAEGFIHDFEGWVVFMACILVLVLEMWLLTKIGSDKRPLNEVFGAEWPEPASAESTICNRPNPKQLSLSMFLVVLAVLLVAFTPEREDVIPERKTFADFPMEIDGRAGKKETLEQIYIDSLKFDDYIMANYIKPESADSINVYIGYYGVQRADKVPHSPRACIPGGGWQISNLTQLGLDGVTVAGLPLVVNRLLIRKGEYKQLVYYWFQQRNRIVTNEYLVKWYLFVDSISRQRTDGALMRFTAFIAPGESIDSADSRLKNFIGSISSIIPQYVPD